MTPDAEARSYFSRRSRLKWWEGLPWILAVAAFFVLPDYMAFGTQVLITIIFALSLDLVVGFAGIVTLGHAAYFGVGAYTAGMVSAHLGWTEPISALLLAGFVAAIVGFITGAVLLRYHGLTLLMLTLATAICLQEFANVNEDVTGGFDGLTGISFAPLLGLFEYDLWGHTYYWYSMVVLFLVFVVVRIMVNSPFGYVVGRHSRKLCTDACNRYASLPSPGYCLRCFRGYRRTGWWSVCGVQRLCNPRCFEFCSFWYDPDNSDSRWRRSIVRSLCRRGGLFGSRG